jgi:hypothetical protein
MCFHFSGFHSISFFVASSTAAACFGSEQDENAKQQKVKNATLAKGIIKNPKRMYNRLPAYCKSQMNTRIISNFPGSATVSVASVGVSPAERCADDNFTRSVAVRACR